MNRRSFLAATMGATLAPAQTNKPNVVMLSLDDLADESVVQKREGAMCALSSADGELSVLLGDRELRLPAWLKPAMQSVLDHEQLPVSQLAPYLDEPGRIVLVRRLIVEGLLEVVE